MTRGSRFLSVLFPLAAVFASTATPARAALTPEQEEGRRLFTEETFAGNGRTCASCHVPTQNLQLTPANVAQRFTTLAQTFDPLFIAESTMNLNTLAIDSVTTFADGAIITGRSSSGATVRAKVLTRASEKTYLVYGGISPAFAPGTDVTDGTNMSGVVKITKGDLDKLESPARMRGSSKSPDFPQGRALILENPDGFDRPAVFRKVPHLQNVDSTPPFGFNNDLGLDEITTRAVQQHFPRTMARRAGIDFRVPTEEELQALRAFLVSNVVEPVRFDLDSMVRTAAQRRGRVAFGVAGCGNCHFDRVLGGRGEDTLTLATGVANQPINGPAPNGDALPKELPVDANGRSLRGIGVPGLINVKNSAPFFHDNSAATLEQAIRFYDTEAFAETEVGRDTQIDLNDARVKEIAVFLRGLVNRRYVVELDGVDMTGEPAIADFGVVPMGGATATRTLVVRNTSTTSVKFASPSCRTVVLSGQASGDFSASCSQLHGVTLLPGQSRPISVTFRPVADGARRGILELLTDDPTGVDLFGTGEIDGVIERFSEDNPDPLAGWRIVFGVDLFAEGGQMHTRKCDGCGSPNGTIIVHSFELPESFDYTIKGIATSDGNDSNDFSVIFNFQDVDQYYYASFNERKDKAGLFKVAAGVKTRLSAFPSATPPGGPSASLHSIKVEKRGGRIRVFQGSTLFADVTDTSVAPGGRAGVGSLNDAGRFDDFRVMNVH
jgi:cytochrome c peroxidase